jgi:hypothetical protein
VLLEAAAKRMDLFLWEFWYANKMALCLHFLVDKLKHRAPGGTRSVA